MHILDSFLQWSFLAAQGSAVPLLPTVLPHVLKVFEAHHHVACLDTIDAAIEATDRPQDGSTRQLLAQALAAVCTAVAPIFQVHSSLEDQAVPVWM